MTTVLITSARPSLAAVASTLLALVIACSCGRHSPPPRPPDEDAAAVHERLVAAVRATTWESLPGAPELTTGGKQDDVYFVNEDVGFVANGPGGEVVKTEDGGATFAPVLVSEAAFYRSLLFVDEQHGFVGNLGAGLVPQIEDDTLMYETFDGGDTWQPVTAITGSAAAGICNFTKIDAEHLVAVGRVGGPAHLVQSRDGGATWTSRDVSAHFAMLIDAHFPSPDVGILAGTDVDGTSCHVARTEDGGATFVPVFSSTTAGSLCWKLSFPSAEVGYVAIQDGANGPGTFAKTVDGGVTWRELPLPASADADAPYPALAIGFLTADIGWVVSADPSLPAYRTFDGGASWEVEPALVGPINRFRFVSPGVAYASGARIWKLTLPE